MSKVETVNQYMEVYTDPPEKVRESSRALIIKDGKVLLTYEKNKDVYMSPGGGVEPGETLEACCMRELREEAGYTVKPIKPFITVNEYSFETLYISNYFLCEITGRCEQSLTETEISHGVMPVWLEIDKAVEVFSAYPTKPQDHMSLYLREYTVLNKYKEKADKQ